MSDDDMPIGLRRLWGLSTTSARGRPATLDVERVLRAAVDLADRDGLQGATLPKISAALGVTSMSLYRYVGSKDELLVLMQDFAMGPPPEIDVRPDQWREGLRRLAGAELRVNHRRPWLARVPILGPPSGPHQIAWMETSLRILRDTGLDWAEKIGIMTLITGYVRHTSLLSQDLARGRDGSGLDQVEAEQHYGRSLARLVQPDRFPETARLLASDIFEASPAETTDDPAGHHDFVFGLERILDGAEAAVDRAG